ncbi:restriction endonuclease [Photobacterium rosenbergii]|uniref:Restriction endonuclease n=1 Tax=Photobacterium rosenbergii TaxID=294936 RepID=A0ABU3ZFB2_9GAMM|nr:restriction endonuclease [Photobacterium rosenbergii]MDV5168814.1 restriction endonuclease [Photobacterium rosenbergii]
MAKKGTEFELFVKAIYNEILEQDGYENVKVEHDINIMGKSGQLHQIDVYWEFKVAGVTHKVAVECKDFGKSAVSVGRIRDFYGVIEDIGNVHGVFVTTIGYQSGAIKYAEHKGISLKVVEQPTLEDIEANRGIDTFNLNIHALCISNSSVTPLLDIDWILDNTEIREGDPINIEGMNDEIKVISSDYSVIGTFYDFECRLPRKPENSKSLKHKFDISDGYLVWPKTKLPPLKIKGLQFTYDTHTLSSNSIIKSKLMAEAVLRDIITGDAHLFNKQIMRVV